MAGCRGRASPSASSGRGARLCDCEGPRGGPDRTPPGQPVEETLSSSLQKIRREQRGSFTDFFMVLAKKKRPNVSGTSLSRLADYFNVLHGNFEELSRDEGRHIHLREKEKNSNN